MTITAKASDFKKGLLLTKKTSGDTFVLTKFYAEGIWETREGKVIYTSNAHLYNIEVNG